MLFSVNRLVSAWLSNISVWRGGGDWRRGSFTLFWTALIWICWNETARAWGSQIALWYPYITEEGCNRTLRLLHVCVWVCVCVCADLSKSIMFLHVRAVYAHRLNLCSPLSSVSCSLLVLSLFLSLFLLSCDYLSLFSSHIFLYPLSFIHWHISPSLPLPLQCIRHITGLLLQSQPSLQQPALKLMAESGDEQLLRLTLGQINSMTAVSVLSPYANADQVKPTAWTAMQTWL